jgi:hypothetical protein
LGVVVLQAPSNHLEDLRPLVPALLEALRDLQPGQVRRVAAGDRGTPASRSSDPGAVRISPLPGRRFACDRPTMVARGGGHGSRRTRRGAGRMSGAVRGG